MNLLKNINVVSFYPGSTLGSSDIDSSVLADMKGYEGILLVAGIVASTGGGTTGSVQLLPRHSDSTSSTGLTDLSSTAAAGVTATLDTGDIGKQLVVDVYRPTKRYISVSLNRAGAAKETIGPIIGIQYGGKYLPQTLSTDYVLDSTPSFSPST